MDPATSATQLDAVEVTEPSVDKIHKSSSVVLDEAGSKAEIQSKESIVEAEKLEPEIDSKPLSTAVSRADLSKSKKNSQAKLKDDSILESRSLSTAVSQADLKPNDSKIQFNTKSQSSRISTKTLSASASKADLDKGKSKKKSLPDSQASSKHELQSLLEEESSLFMETADVGVETQEGEDIPEPLTEQELKKKAREERKSRQKQRFRGSESLISFETDAPLIETPKVKYIEERKNQWKPRHAKLLDHDYEDTIMRDVTHEDELELEEAASDISLSDTSTASQTARGHDSVQLKTDFLNSFELPELSDISEEEETIIPLKAAPAGVLDAAHDIGVFVDPLTGEKLPSSESPASSVDELPVEEEAAMDTETEESLDLADLPDLEEEVQEPPKIKVEDEMEAFVKFHKSFIHHESTIIIDEGFGERRKQRQELSLITDAFLRELFDEVVTKSELMNADFLMRARCDKEKLLTKLVQMTETHITEKYMNSLLNLRMIEYYKRLKTFRTFATLSPTAERRERRRYNEALIRLDMTRKRAAVAKRKNSYLMSDVLMDLHYMQIMSKHTELNLHETMCKYLLRKDSEFLKRLVERELRLMTNKRNEISDTRLFLITRQHTLGRISEKINKLEQISDDLHIEDFIAIQNQVATLSTKIEERNVELKKLHGNYRMDLHLTQHLREKMLTVVNKLEENKRELKNKQQQEQELRERLYEGKMERTRIWKKHKELSEQGGILSMPALMLDFDRTVERVQTKQATVLKLRENLKNLNTRIAFHETRGL